MNEELLATFDEQGNRTGAAPRDEVHRRGLWHETFHCWFVRMDVSGLMIYLQLRSLQKETTPVCSTSPLPDICWRMRPLGTVSVRSRRSWGSRLLLTG